MPGLDPLTDPRWWFRLLKERGEVCHPLPNGQPGSNLCGLGFEYATHRVRDGLRLWIRIEDLRTMETTLVLRTDEKELIRQPPKAVDSSKFKLPSKATQFLNGIGAIDMSLAMGLDPQDMANQAGVTKIDKPALSTGKQKGLFE